MILRDEVFKIGKFAKPHGIKGEIAMWFDNDIFDRADCPYLVCLIEGIFVPFFIIEYRFKGSETALFLLEDVDSEEKAKRLCGHEVYYPRIYMEDKTVETDYSWSFFIGYKLMSNNTMIGEIEAVDESTINTLFLIKTEEDHLMVPATEDFIEKIDTKTKMLHMCLPEGLI